MAAHPEFDSYADFFPYYVAMHSKPATRKVHFAGTTIGLVLALVGLVTRRPRMLLALPGFGYGFAWPAHWFIEKNNPASFGHPLWSLRGDFEMITYMMRGRDGELTKIAHGWFRQQDARTAAGAASDGTAAADTVELPTQGEASAAV
jgi:hypothetical protein